MFVCAENDEGKVPFARSIEGPLRSRKDLGNSRGDLRDGKKGILAHNNRILAHNNQKSLPQLPHLNGLDVDGDHHISKQISVYNRLLKDGRYLASSHCMLLFFRNHVAAL